ncbi:hypothetical protein [Actinoplanes sp. NPDC051851]|uniref:COG1470 family protein n=1 Tax=Actinoplanes sp. NPDC051851 TaxID=3154753 RepID=UPI0034369E37
MRRLTALTATLAATLVVAGTGPAVALAAPVAAAATAADFSVSTSAERLEPDANGDVDTQLTIANNGDQALTVAIRATGVTAKDDGQVEFSDQADGVWSKTATFPSSLELAARTYQRVPVSLHRPAGLLPDIYLIGFVVEAQPSGASAAVKVYHQIGALLTVEIPGSRDRKMAVTVDDTSWIHLGSTFRGEFRVSNVGEAAALGRGQVKVDSTLTKENVGTFQATDQMELFPSGTTRHLEYEYTAHGLFLIARPQAQVLYGSGSGILQMAEGDGRSILIIPWLTLILLGAVAVALSGYLYWLRRRRLLLAAERRDRKGRHRQTWRRRASACAD